MSRQWSQSVVVITGASQGIGRAYALECAKLGAQVHVCARNQDALASLAQLNPTHIFPHVLDVTDEDAVARVARDVSASHGRVDVLMLNASMLGVGATPLADYNTHVFRQTLDVNTTGTFLCLKHFGELLSASQDAVCAIISSSVGRKGRGTWGAYSVSKFGAEALVGIAADEWEVQGTACISINPGGTATAMRADAYPEEDPNTLPSAAKVAQTFILLTSVVGMSQTRARYNSRDLFSWVQRPVEDIFPGELPTV